jgi:hypothetical protein
VRAAEPAVSLAHVPIQTGRLRVGTLPLAFHSNGGAWSRGGVGTFAPFYYARARAREGNHRVPDRLHDGAWLRPVVATRNPPRRTLS